MNKLYYGDNLEILREMADETVDLIYIDPPFNSKRAYNVIFKDSDGDRSEAQIQAFDDTWQWTQETEDLYRELTTETVHTNLSETISSFVNFMGTNNLMAYLVNMSIRIVELHRVLKPTGSFYLHCDPTASHYLKIMLDQIFGAKNFRNEIIWKRATAKSNVSRRRPNMHDVIFSYLKTESATWNVDEIFAPYDLDDLDSKTQKQYSKIDADGRRYQLTDLTSPSRNRPNLTYEFLGVTRVWRWTSERMTREYEAGNIVQTRPGTVPRYKRYLDEQRGTPIGDIWTDIAPLQGNSKERIGYPTQKPEALLERIIKASSNEGDLILDAFCGCGTAIAAAQQLNRQWIGIDITHLAISLIEYRLKKTFASEVEYEVFGVPKDLEGAKNLATRKPDGRYQFQWWAISLIDGARPYRNKKRGADGGIDGIIHFNDVIDGKKVTSKIVIQVKSGKVAVKDIRELMAVVERNSAVIGVFVTLKNPTAPMKTEAVKGGKYSRFERSFPKIQIFTVEELLSGSKVDRPMSVTVTSVAKIERHQKDNQIPMEKNE